MMSDNDDDSWFDYGSSQDYSYIDYQIDLFEMRQSIKRDRYWKQKRNQLSYPISTRKLQAHAVLLKITCKRYEQKPKIKLKSFGYQHFSSISKTFECDEEYLTKSTDTESTKRSKSSKKSIENDLIIFSHFREEFYQKHHKNIKSSLNKRSSVNIINIRPAEVHESVQIEFVKRLKNNSSVVPHLVYHGTSLKNIESILRFGFLVPNQAHPTIKNAPVIRSVNGQVYGQGIYCSRTASYSLYYTTTANTLLVCATIPNCDRMGQVEYVGGHILVLSHVSQIIPLFLMDFCPSDGIGYPHSWYPSYTQSTLTNIIPKEKQPMVIAKQILRKILSCVNNRVQKSQRYQMRLFD